MLPVALSFVYALHLDVLEEGRSDDEERKGKEKRSVRERRGGPKRGSEGKDWGDERGQE